MKKAILIIILVFMVIIIPTSVKANTYLWENSTWQEGLTASWWTSAVLGDIDNDNRSDLVQIGCTSTSGGTACDVYLAKVYINNGTTLVENSTWQSNLTAVHYGSLAFGDIDNDGDLDLALSGCNNGGGSVSACNTMRIQSIRDLDKGTWRKFVAYCKLKDVKVGDELNKILEEYIKKNFKNLLKK